MKKILIIGGSGFLGLKTIRQLKRNYNLIATHNKNLPKEKGVQWVKLDILDKEKVKDFIIKTKPSCIIFLAAVSSTQKSKTETSKINVLGLKNVVDTCKDIKCKFIFLSSDYVFDGKKGEYLATDKPKPINDYGISKYKGEKIVKSLNDFNIIRSSTMYGTNEKFQHKNFVTQAMENLEKNKKVVTFNDVYRNPVYIEDVAKVVSKLIKVKGKKIVNVGGPDYISFTEFAYKTAKAFSFNMALIEAKKCDIYIPKKLGLNVKKTEKELNMNFLSVNDGLKKMKLEGGL